MTKKPPRKILFVDDDEDIIKIAELSLKSFKDVEIVYLKSGEEALEAAFSSQPDLIIMDIVMSGIGGVAALQALKENPSLKSIPVIFLTARILKNEIEEYKKLGVQGIITKPFDPLELPQQILKLWEEAG